jgi:glutathione S-transferase
MILVGQYDSPYVRRVAISLRVLDLPYEHDTRSVFGDFDSMRKTNPLARIPSLILDDGEVLFDSAAILDHLDELVGPAKALLPRSGGERREALRRIALATGAIDKIGGGRNYELMIRPERFRWPEWVERVTVQGCSALGALNLLDWPATASLDQSQITTACALDYVRVTAPDLAWPGRYPKLEMLLASLCMRPEFIATSFSEYKLPQGRVKTCAGK